MRSRDVSVLVVDDQPLVRAGAVAVLDAEDDIHVVGQAGDGRAAVRMVGELRPRVTLMDLEMPELNGLEAARQVLHAYPSARIVGLSAVVDATRVASALEAGLAGYLVKSCETEEVVRAVRAAAEGQMYLSPEAAALVVDRWVNRGAAPAAAPAESPSLTRREREVLQLVAEGHSTKQIARVLGVSVKTVESHRHQITRRLRLHSIAELTKYAVRHGLTTLDA